jgi:non-homologous end joining protein Ku
MRERQVLAAIRARADVLVLETLRDSDEVRDPVEEIETLPIDARARKSARAARPDAARRRSKAS